MSNLTALLNKYKALVIFDTETSGLDFDKDQIIELAALRVERTASGGLRIAGKMDTFIKLSEGETLPELEDLPIADILRKIGETFSHWDALSPTDYENPNGGAFQITATPQIVRIDCYGVSGDDMNRLMDILIAFGCPLYDPQISERFDSWTDR